MVRISDLINTDKTNKKEIDKKEEKELSLTDIESKYTSFLSCDRVPVSPPKIKESPLAIKKLKSTEPADHPDQSNIDEVHLNTHSIEMSDLEKIKKEPASSDDLYNRAMDVLGSSLNLYMTSGKIDIDGIASIADDFIRGIRKDNSLFVNALFFMSAKFNLIQHQVDVAVFSLKIGMSLGIDESRLKKLIMGALLHDIGFLKIPESIIAKTGDLTNEEKAEIKKHPLISRDIIQNALGDKYAWLSSLVCGEHEKEDGSGYPFGLQGNKIDMLAKIIGICDIYEALTHPRPQRGRMTPFDAVKIIITSFKKAFPREILKALVSELSAFPVGSYVLLNSNKVGRVIEINPLSPLKPKIEILYDSSGEKLSKKEIVDLNRDTLLNITGPVFYEDLH